LPVPTPPLNIRTITLLTTLGAALQLSRFRDPAYAIDDAWISFRIARNLVEHGVLTYNTGQPPVEGMTNLLWTLLSTTWIAALPGVDPIGPARIVGAVLWIATIAVGVPLAARLAAAAGGKPRVAAAVAGLLMASSGAMAYHATNGLETALWGLLALASISRALGEGRGAVLGGLLSMLALTRPEGVMVGGLVIGFVAWRAPRRALVVAGVFGAAVLSLTLWRWGQYGQIVPNTFFAKPPWLGGGLRSLQSFVLYGLGGAGILAVLPSLRTHPGRALVGLATVLIAATVATGGDWMSGHRRFTVAFLALSVAGGLGVACAKGPWRALAALGVVGWLGGNAVGAYQGEDAGWAEPDLMHRLGQAAAASPDIGTVALVDIGRFGWNYPGDILDLVGLTDATIAHLPEGGVHMERWSADYFDARRPDLVFLILNAPQGLGDPLPALPSTRSGLEGELLVHLLDRDDFHMHRAPWIMGTTFLAVFVRDGVALPPEHWGAPREKGLRQLVTEFHQRAPPLE
jgi:hypothetical protein